MMPAVDGILFDLDGTLVDSAPQLTASANALRMKLGLPPLVYPAIRNAAGAGARGLLWRALRITPDAPHFASLKKAFLTDYEARLTTPAVLFSGIETLLTRLTENNVPWGIVTNKPERLAQLVVASHPVLRHARCLVGGDTTPEMKPSPLPVLEGVKRLHLTPQKTIYAGDDERDIRAGRAAGLKTLALTWGYIAGGLRPPSAWGADFLITSADEITERFFGRNHPSADSSEKTGEPHRPPRVFSRKTTTSTQKSPQTSHRSGAGRRRRRLRR